MASNNLVFRNYGITLNVPQLVVHEWRSFRQLNSRAKESFGVLIGSRTDGTREYWIDAVTQPCENDQATRYSFQLQDKQHQQAVDKAFKQSGGSSVYLGTWHTHPEMLPIPSMIDVQDWLDCLKRNPKRQLFFVIVGKRYLRVFVYKQWGNRFGSLKLSGRREIKND